MRVLAVRGRARSIESVWSRVGAACGPARVTSDSAGGRHESCASSGGDAGGRVGGRGWPCAVCAFVRGRGAGGRCGACVRACVCVRSRARSACVFAACGMCEGCVWPRVFRGFRVVCVCVCLFRTHTHTHKSGYLGTVPHTAPVCVLGAGSPSSGQGDQVQSRRAERQRRGREIEQCITRRRRR